jgi:hypothetical protein
LRECSSCQTVNDNSAQFCLECGQKLAPPGRGSVPDEQAPASPSGRPRLHSPILGGYEDIDDSPRKGEKPKNNNAPRAKGAHLRSPLLGGSDEDEAVDDPAMKPIKGRAPLPKSGGKMRSPLLGGGSGPSSDDDYEEDFPLRDRNDSHSAFPHRSRPREADPEMPAPQQHSGKAHLRSPLLGGSDADDDYEEEQFSPQPAGRKQQTGNSRPQKLHSPIFDRSPSSGGYDDYDDDDGQDIDDPNVLRSPLLAAKSRLPQGQGRINQNQPRPYPPNDAPQSNQNAQGAGQQGNAQQANYNQQPGNAQQAPYNQQPQQAAYNQQPGNPQQAAYNQQPQQAAYNQQPADAQQISYNQQPGGGQPAAYNQQPGDQSYGQPPGQPAQPAQQTQPGQPSMGQPSAQPGQAPQPQFNSPPLNIQQPGFTPGNTNSAGSTSQGPALSNQPGQAYEYGAPGASLSASPSLPTSYPSPSQNALSQRSTILESTVQAQQPAPAPTKSPIFPTVVSSTANGAAAAPSRSFDDDDFPEHPAVNDLAPLPKPKQAKLGGGRFAQPATLPDDDDDDDLNSSHGSRGLPLSAQQPMSRKRLSPVADDNSHAVRSAGGAPSGPIMVLFVTGFLGAISKVYFIFSFFKSFTAPGAMPMMVDQIGQLAIFVGLIIYAVQGTRK